MSDNTISGNDFYKVLYHGSPKKAGIEIKLRLWLLKNSLGTDPAAFLMIAAVVFSFIFMICLFFKYGLLIFIIVCAVVSLIFYIFVDLRRRRIISKKESQLEGFLIDLTGNLYANPNILQCIRKTMQSTDEPLRWEFETLVDETRRGVLLNDALENLVIRNDSKIIRFIISGLIAANEKGVDLIGFLKDQTEYLREKKSITSYVRILSSGPRYSSYVIMLIPVIVLGAASMLNKGFGRSLVSPPGLWVLLYASVSFVTGFLIINRIVNLSEGGK